MKKTTNNDMDIQKEKKKRMKTRISTGRSSNKTKKLLRVHIKQMKQI